MIFKFQKSLFIQNRSALFYMPFWRQVLINFWKIAFIFWLKYFSRNQLFALIITLTGSPVAINRNIFKVFQKQK